MIAKQMHDTVFLRVSHLNLFIMIATSIIGESEKGYYFFLEMTTFSSDITRVPTLPTAT